MITRHEKAFPGHYRSRGRGFWSGFLGGLAAIAMLDHRMAPRAYGGRGLRGDWQAVGNDLRHAMKNVDEQRGRIA